MADTKRTPFTDDQLRYIRERFTEASAGQIAAHLGVNKKQLANYIYRLRKKEGLSRAHKKPLTKTDIERIHTMAAEGNSIMQIAEALKRSYYTIYAVFLRDKIKLPRDKRIKTAKPSSTEKKQISRRRSIGMPIRSSTDVSTDSSTSAEDGIVYCKTPREIKEELSRKKVLTSDERYRLLICKQITEQQYQEYEYKNK